MDMKKTLKSAKIIPVITIKNLENALPIAHALIEGGIKVLEITLRTSVALEAIKVIKEKHSDCTILAGTAIEPEQIQKAKVNGADIIVSPGITSRLIKAIKENNIDYLPGVATCSEIIKARENGYHFLKFFPAQLSGGIKTLKAFSAVFPDISFCPTGGVDAENFIDYLRLENVVCVGGSWLTPKKYIEVKDFQQITDLAKFVKNALSTL